MALYVLRPREEETEMPSSRLSSKPRHMKLTWPGLRAQDRLSRIITAWVKEQKEESENEAWARDQVARVLDWIPPETVMKLLYREARRRNSSIPSSPTFISSRLVTPQIRMGITT
jgi:hypothetical protein